MNTNNITFVMKKLDAMNVEELKNRLAVPQSQRAIRETIGASGGTLL